MRSVLKKPVPAAEADANPQDRAHELTARTRERDSLRKIVLGMAIDKYGYDPKRSRNQATRQIVEACQRIGINIDDQTVLAHLRAAAEQLPGDYE